MSDNQEIVIQDTCILFDLVDLELLKHFFQLDFIVYTTVQVVEEIKTEIHKQEISKYIDNNELNVDSEGDFEAISYIFETHSALSYTDSSVSNWPLEKMP